jgi:hypothetical protein
MSDEGAVAVSSIADKAFSPRIDQIENEWETFGPLSARIPLFNATQRYSEWCAVETLVLHSMLRRHS